ncbi:MAG: D-glucuronyl C5-epimerase family protein [Clostridiales bacterium]|nr:D-glucuronyl C5-epimerase family protein [Clostridiales bacterium]
MALSMFKIKRWIKMLSGKSIDHVNQDKGKCFSTNGKISGYYNNLTEKVTKNPGILNSDELPMLQPENMEPVYFPVAIFQYGLGAYDMFLITGDKKYLKKFMQAANWALDHIDEKGRWNNFFFYSPDTPYGAMAQGEGASLLIRAFKHTGESKYLNKAQSAIDFMLKPLENGGTTKYDGTDAYLMEYTFKGMVLNGAIFAWWGLYDYVTITNDTYEYKSALNQTLNTLLKTLPQFKCNYWSMYSLDGLIASPFYHNLHVAQMEAMFELTGKPIFKEYSQNWKYQQHNYLCKSRAFMKKALQKIAE